MKLLELTSESVRGVPDGRYAFSTSGAAQPSSSPLDFCVVPGPRGSGKSSLLASIVAVHRVIETRGVLPTASAWLRSGATSGRITATWELSSADLGTAEAERIRQHSEWTFSTAAAPRVVCDEHLDRILRHRTGATAECQVAWIGADRRMRAQGPRPPWMGSLAIPWLHADAPEDSFECIPYLLADRATQNGLRLSQLLGDGGIVLGSDGPDALDGVRAGLESMLPELRLVDARLVDERAVVRFIHRDGRELPLHQLSDTERQAVLLTVVLRHPTLRGGVVLIDSPELHLPSADHARFLDKLAALAPAHQLIVATGSEEIARSHASSVVARLGSTSSPRSTPLR